MFSEPLTTVTQTALNKKNRLEQSLSRYLVSSALAGAYIGLAIVLIMVIGGQLSLASSPYTTIFMGASFGYTFNVRLLMFSFYEEIPSGGFEAGGSVIPFIVGFIFSYFIGKYYNKRVAQ